MGRSSGPSPTPHPRAPWAASCTCRTRRSMVLEAPLHHWLLQSPLRRLAPGSRQRRSAHPCERGTPRAPPPSAFGAGGLAPVGSKPCSCGFAQTA
eukprot:12106886-Alexandrium_andersonii.AAC.1